MIHSQWTSSRESRFASQRTEDIYAVSFFHCYYKNKICVITTYKYCYIYTPLNVIRVLSTTERSFSSMKLIKTRLRIRLEEDTPESTKCICIEGSGSLDGNTLESLQSNKTS